MFFDWTKTQMAEYVKAFIKGLLGSGGINLEVGMSQFAAAIIGGSVVSG